MPYFGPALNAIGPFNRSSRKTKMGNLGSGRLNGLIGAPPELKGVVTDSKHGAGDGIRTRDINLGKVALYQLSYSRF